MSQIRRPVVTLPSPPPEYDQREQKEFRRIVMQALGESVEDLVRPSLSVTVEPSSTAYEIVVTYTGTMTYTIDAGAPVNGTASPQTLNVSRPLYGAAPTVYAFKVENAAQTMTAVVEVAARDAGASTGVLTSCDARNTIAPADGGGSFDIFFNAVGFPTGTTYNLAYDITSGHFGGGSTSGTATGITSGQTISHPLQPTVEGELVVTAHLAGVQIGVVASAGAFAV